MGPGQRALGAQRRRSEPAGLERLLKQARRDQERLQWEFLRERRSTRGQADRPNPTEEASRIWHQEPDKASVLKLLCGSCPAERARPRLGEVFATPHGLLLAAIYEGPNLRGTEASGSLRRFRTGQWLDLPPRTFAARCRRCGRLYLDATGTLVAEVRDRVRRRETHWVVDERYRYATT